LEDAQLKLAKAHLCGYARDWYRRYGQAIERAEKPWEAFKKALVARFQKSKHKDGFGILMKFHIKKDEGFERYIERFDKYYTRYREESKEIEARRLAKEAAKTGEGVKSIIDFELPAVTQRSVVKFFVAGLPKEIRKEMEGLEIDFVEEAYNHLLKLMPTKKVKRRQSKKSGKQSIPRKGKRSSSSSSDSWNSESESGSSGDDIGTTSSDSEEDVPEPQAKTTELTSKAKEDKG
jgi:hypothetical protein